MRVARGLVVVRLPNLNPDVDSSVRTGGLLHTGLVPQPRLCAAHGWDVPLDHQDHRDASEMSHGEGEVQCSQSSRTAAISGVPGSHTTSEIHFWSM